MPGAPERWRPFLVVDVEDEDEEDVVFDLELFFDVSEVLRRIGDMPMVGVCNSGDWTAETMS